MSDGSLGAEIERRSAEIRNWPNWAQPYNPPHAPTGDAGEHRRAHGDQPPSHRSGAEIQPPTDR